MDNSDLPSPLLVRGLLDMIPDEETPCPENRNDNDEHEATDNASDSSDLTCEEIDAEPFTSDYEDASGTAHLGQDIQTANQTPTAATQTQEGATEQTEIIDERYKKHDVVLVFDELDEDVACDILMEMEKIEVDGENIDVRSFNDPTFGANKMDWAKKIRDSCLLVFVVQTDKTPKDFERKFLKDEIGALKRVEEGVDSIQSLMVCDGLEKLSGLASLDPFLWYKKARRHHYLKGRIRHLRSSCNKGPSKPVDKCDGASRVGKEQYRGKCIIVNNWKFNSTKTSDRLSARGQEEKVKRLFKSRNFNAVSYENRTLPQMETLLDDASKEDYSEYECFVFYVMSHGCFDQILCSDDKMLQIREQWKKFLPKNCESLRDKAKVFFFCSCRLAVGIEHLLVDEYDDEDEEEMKDFFFCYSCQPGTKATKNVEKNTGDIFTQEFLAVMEENEGYNSMEFKKLMDIVKERVKERIQYAGGEEHFSIPEIKTKSNIRLVL